MRPPIRRTNATFTNWAGNQSCIPSGLHHPADTAAIAELVAAAHQAQSRVKVVGAGHSFTDTAMTDGAMLSIDRINKIESIDQESGVVVVGAGIQLHELSIQLAAAGLAMPNLGDIDVQSFAGATATATHGTGAGLGNIATTIVGMEIVTGAGDIIWCDAESNSEMLAVARVGIGALGVVTKVAVQTVPAFNLSAEERVESVTELLDDLPGFLRSAEHAEFFWLPGGDKCLTKRNNRTNQPAQPVSKARHFAEKVVAENVALDIAMRTVRRFPSQRDRVVAAFTKSISDRTAVDESYKIFASPRHVKFMEMEYGIPVDAVTEAFTRVQRLIASMPDPPLFPIEVRISQGDDIPLSTAQGRDTAWIAVHRYKGLPYGDYFRGVEAIMNDYDGRPHWGKFHYQTAATLAPRYPEWDRFAKARKELDSTGVFANAYTDRILGPVASGNTGA